MKAKLLILAASSILALSACGIKTNPSSSQSSESSSIESSSQGGSSSESVSSSSASSEGGSSEESSTLESSSSQTSEEESMNFQGLVQKILTTHNYTIDVACSWEEETYEDHFYNINDGAYYSTYYGAPSGLIRQKDQGYIGFTQNGNTINPGTFYSINHSVGISALYHIAGERLFAGGFVEDGERYKNTNFDAVALACIYSGYNTTYMTAPQAIYASFNQIKETLTITADFNLYYIDEENDGTSKISPGTVALTFKNVGTTRNAAVESYLENPTHTFAAQTAWNADQTALFNKTFMGVVPSFLTGATPMMRVIEDSDYQGSFLLLTDYGIGDVRESYGSTLVAKDGFTEVTKGKKYNKVLKDDATQKTTTYTVDLAYVSPTDRDIDSVRYPKGIFQIKYSVKVVNNVVDSVASFNEYLTANGLTAIVPSLPWGEECTKISGFVDKTVSINQIYDANYVFHTGNAAMKLYIDTYDHAIADLNAYIAALESYGYVNEDDSSSGQLIAMTLPDDSGVVEPNYVYITNPNTLTKANYASAPYVNLRFVLNEKAASLVTKK